MKKYVVIAAIMLLAGCTSQNNERISAATQDKNSPDVFLGYQAIDPLPVDKVALYDKSANQMKETYWAETNDVTVRDLLPLQSAQVFVTKNDISGKVSYLTAAISGETGSYTVIMDYIKYRVEDIVDDANDEYLGSARIGVGLRIKAVVVTSKAGLNLGGLMGIGLEAKQGNLRGGISVDVIGIDSESVTNLIPLTSEIDQTSIQSALQALASIKTKIYDDKTKLTPHLVAIKQVRAKKSQQIKEKATTSIRKGIFYAQSRMDMEAKILSAIAPGDVLDKAKWDDLVDKSNLSNEQKAKLKALDNKDKIKNRLDIDVGVNGTIISAIYKVL
jgi:hypothetical protein